MKKFFVFAGLFFMCLLFTGCDSEKPVVVFSKTPFSAEQGHSPANTFHTGDKIYWAVYNPDEFKTRLLKLQVFRKDKSTSEFWAYEYLYNRTLELTNKKAYTDFVVINNKGHYIFQIFDYTNFQEPVAIGMIDVI